MFRRLKPSNTWRGSVLVVTHVALADFHNSTMAEGTERLNFRPLIITQCTTKRHTVRPTVHLSFYVQCELLIHKFYVGYSSIQIMATLYQKTTIIIHRINIAQITKIYMPDSIHTVMI